MYVHMYIYLYIYIHIYIYIYISHVKIQFNSMKSNKSHEKPFNDDSIQVL
jgi:hypothetical protein